MAFKDSKEAKAAGWFSRRHQSYYEHQRAVTEHATKDLRREEAIERQFDREKRSDEEQLRKLTLEGHENCREAKLLREKLGAK